MTRVIVHAGFHKTATSSLQTFLQQNRAALKSHFDYYGQADFQSAGSAARFYGQRPFVWRRLRFRFALRRFLRRIADARTIVLSRETFAGVMPGHRDVFGRMITHYAPTAIPLAREIIRELKKRFGAETEIIFVYTTRAQAPWLRSVYGHLLRSIHLRDEFEDFCTQFAVPPHTEYDAQAIATALAPVPVYIARLEDFSDHAEGPAAALLDLADVPADARTTLLPAPHKNLGQSAEIEREFLRLNRSGQRKQTLKLIKDRILKVGHTL